MDNLLHGGIAFLTPFVLAFIIYPIAKRFNKDWISLLTGALFLSLVVMIVKEITDQYISRADIIADLAGIFLGLFVLAGIFFLGNAAVNKEGRLLLRWRSKVQKRSLPSLIFRKREASLREVLFVGVKLSQSGARFYREMAYNVDDLATKELCWDLAKAEECKAARLADTLNTWLPRPLSPQMVEWSQTFIYKNNLYITKFTSHSSKKEILTYAVTCKDKMRRFYSHFKSSFPELWKRMHLDYLIQEEMNHKEELRSVLKRGVK